MAKDKIKKIMGEMEQQESVMRAVKSALRSDKHLIIIAEVIKDNKGISSVHATQRSKGLNEKNIIDINGSAVDLLLYEMRKGVSKNG